MQKMCSSFVKTAFEMINNLKVQLETSKKHQSGLQEKYSGTLQRLAHNARQKLQEKKVCKATKETKSDQELQKICKQQTKKIKGLESQLLAEKMKLSEDKSDVANLIIMELLWDLSSLKDAIPIIASESNIPLQRCLLKIVGDASQKDFEMRRLKACLGILSNIATKENGAKLLTKRAQGPSSTMQPLAAQLLALVYVPAVLNSNSCLRLLLGVFANLTFSDTGIKYLIEVNLPGVLTRLLKRPRTEALDMTTRQDISDIVSNCLMKGDIYAYFAGKNELEFFEVYVSDEDEHLNSVGRKLYHHLKMSKQHLELALQEI